jgi:Flp pilus assembly protein TadD
MKNSPMYRLPVLMMLLLFPGVVIATDPWLGQKVFWKSGARAKIGDAAIHIEKIPFPAKVERVEGDWVWLERAWVHKQDVMSTDQALEYYSHKIDFNPINDVWWRRRSPIWSEKGEYQNALQDCNDAIRIDPKNASAYSHRGLAYQFLGDVTNAMKDFNDAIDLDPKYARAYKNRGNLFLLKGNFELAIADFTEAFRLDPYDAAAYLGRGIARNSSGEFEHAIDDYKQAIELDPKSAAAYDALALLRASCPDENFRDGNQAILDAAKACELSEWKNWSYLGTLGAAYAEAGDFESAVKWQEQAVDLATADKDKLQALQRLQSYKAEQPFRIEPKTK